MPIQLPNPDPLDLRRLMFGVKRDPPPFNERYWLATLSSTVTTAAPSTNVTGAGVLYGFQIIGAPAVNARLKVYTGTSAAGTLLADYLLDGAGHSLFIPNVEFAAGAHIVIVGAGSGVTAIIKRAVTP
jgi:hypothetical protein